MRRKSSQPAALPESTAWSAGIGARSTGCSTSITSAGAGLGARLGFPRPLAASFCPLEARARHPAFPGAGVGDRISGRLVVSLWQP
jgi:hypothetical protein